MHFRSMAIDKIIDMPVCVCVGNVKCQTISLAHIQAYILYELPTMCGCVLIMRNTIRNRNCQ